MLNAILFSLAIVASLFSMIDIIIRVIRNFKVYYLQIIVFSVSLTAVITHIIRIW